MSSLALSFENIYKKVSEFLGLGSSPADSNLTKVKDIVYRGYRRFLYPANPQTGEVYIWSFLRKSGTLITQTGQGDYPLPSDFTGLIFGFKFDAGENEDNPKRIDMSKLKSMRSVAITTGTPEYYAINVNPYDVETGLFYGVSFYKPPSAALTYKYEYVFDPPKPVETTDLFVGGVRASEVILDCALAAAELQEDDVTGPKEVKATQSITSLIEYDKIHLLSAIELDPNLLPNIPRFRMATPGA